jgi:ribosomal protein L37AE/L43A
MDPLVEGIFQCPKCKKIIKEKKKEIDQEKEEIVGEILEGDYFHGNASLNKKYEICEKGITITKSPNRWIAALICHSPYLSSSKYIRLSWWKKEIYQHAGFFKITEPLVLINLIKALEKINSSFDDFWGNFNGFVKNKTKTEEDHLRDEHLKILKYRIIENRICPNCGNKLTFSKRKTHYECEHCGEIIILESYNEPIFNINPKDLPLEFSTNFPINYYLPVAGITIKWLMGEWKAVVVIYSNDNPNKKWLRFYAWERNLQQLLKFGYHEAGDAGQLSWTVKKGMASPNIFEKAELTILIDSLKKLENELGWDKYNKI